MSRRIGVLALQGAFDAHVRALTDLGVDAVEVRMPVDLAGVEALVLPGGESTTMSILLEQTGLYEPVAECLAGGMPAFGTCAGMILLANNVVDGRPDQRYFGVIDLSVRRNGYGRQVDSFESDIDVAGVAGGPFHALFIRAPVVEKVGADVEVLASVDGHPVLCRSGRITVAAFHPELSGDWRLHAQFLEAMA